MKDETIHSIQKFVDNLWMIVFIVGGLVFAYESTQTADIIRFAYLSAGLLLGSIGVFGRAYPEIEKDALG